MSRIYRSIDQSPPFVKGVDVQQNRLASPAADRPQGGFFGARSVPSGQRPLSLSERREQEARNLIEQAQGRAEAIQREAYHAGFEEGERAGRKMAAQKLQPALQSLSDLVQAISAERDALLHQHKSELIKIAFLIAAQAVHKTIELAPDTVAAVVDAAFQKVAKDQEVIVRVAPQDLQLLEQLIKDNEAPFPVSDRMRLTPDESISRGGCRVTTPIGDIDATIEGQLRALKSVLW